MRLYINSICMQVKLMVNKKEFHVAFIINLGYVLLTYLYNVWKNFSCDISTIISPSAAFSLQAASEFYDLYINIVPFVVVIPFAMSYISDRNNLLLPVLQVRSGVKHYYLSKGVACFAGAFLSFFIPLMISILLNHLTFPESGITFIGDLNDINYNAGIVGSNVLINTNWAGIWFPKLFISNSQIYNIIFTLIFSTAMGIFSVFVYALSFIINKQKILLMLPLYLIIVTFNTIDLFQSGRTPYMCYKVLLYITVNTMYGKNPMFIFSFFLFVVAASGLLIYRQSHKDQMN